MSNPQRPLASQRQLLVLLAAAVVQPAAAQVGGDLLFRATPSRPAADESVEIFISRYFGMPAQELVSQSLVVDGYDIDAQIVLQDLRFNPGAVFKPVVVEDGAAFDLGPLLPGVYTVNAVIGLTPWPHTILADGGIDYFNQTAVRGAFEFEVYADHATGSNGDFNGDRLVDAADYTVWRDTAMEAEAYAAWADGFGDTFPPAEVPEPVGLALALLVAAAATGPRRPRRQLGS